MGTYITFINFSEERQINQLRTIWSEMSLLYIVIALHMPCILPYLGLSFLLFGNTTFRVEV